MSNVKVTVAFDAPEERAADLARAFQDLARAQDCTPHDAEYDPPLAEFAPGISAEEAAYRRIHGPPLRCHRGTAGCDVVHEPDDAGPCFGTGA
jgi:hypothetical protein